MTRPFKSPMAGESESTSGNMMFSIDNLTIQLHLFIFLLVFKITMTHFKSAMSLPNQADSKIDLLASILNEIGASQHLQGFARGSDCAARNPRILF
jgi:hypothetical protein